MTPFHIILSYHRVELNTRLVEIIFISFTLFLENKIGWKMDMELTWVLGKLELIGGIK